MQRKSTSRCLSLLSFIPLAQLGIEKFVFGEDQLTRVQFVCMLILLTGSLCITAFVQQPKGLKSSF